MNPEFERNLWLELTRRRMTQMAVVVALILLASDISAGPAGLSMAAQYLFYGIVVVWGSRDAAQAVVGEIRDRTWDFQRLSSLSPFAMTWGKLLGATSYAWFGGLICLAVLIAGDLMGSDPNAAAVDLGYYLSIGLMAQASALFASLIAVRRRQTHSRFNVFLYQSVGIVAAWCVWGVWLTGAPGADKVIRIDDIAWWGMIVGARQFYLGSLVVFLSWTLIGCYRLMRTELQMQNRPTVWVAFVLFMALYTGGFEKIPIAEAEALTDLFAIRLALAAGTLAILTYLAVLFEPKDRVLYRWLGEMFAKRRVGAVASRLQGWMIAYAAALIVGIALVVRLAAVAGAGQDLAPMALAGLGFLTRDLGVFLFFSLAQGQKRGDMPAVVALGVLYLVAPELLNGIGAGDPHMVLFPTRDAGWMGAAIAWAEGIAVWAAVLASTRKKQAVAAPQGKAA